MKSIRAVIRILLVAISTITLYVIYYIGYLMGKIFGARYEPLRNFFMTLWANTILFILNIHVQVTGQPPKAPFFLISNHLSYIDILPLYQNLDCTFVAKKEVEFWPLIGYMARTMGVIFIDRTRKVDVGRVNRIISNSLNDNQGIVLFPEGTTSAGERVLPFKASLLEHPASIKFDVHYATISYQTSDRDPPASESVCWWGGISFPAHIIRLVKNRRIDCQIIFGDQTISNPDRKQLADELHEKVSQQFQPVTDKIISESQA
jgi:lyso-ornithine lipid O-acyltransferase